jgi:hypothetical protein
MFYIIKIMKDILATIFFSVSVQGVSEIPVLILTSGRTCQFMKLCFCWLTFAMASEVSSPIFMFYTFSFTKYCNLCNRCNCQKIFGFLSSTQLNRLKLNFQFHILLIMFILHMTARKYNCNQ